MGGTQSEPLHPSDFSRFTSPVCPLHCTCSVVVLWVNSTNVDPKNKHWIQNLNSNCTGCALSCWTVHCRADIFAALAWWCCPLLSAHPYSVVHFKKMPCISWCIQWNFRFQTNAEMCIKIVLLIYVLLFSLTNHWAHLHLMLQNLVRCAEHSTVQKNNCRNLLFAVSWGHVITWALVVAGFSPWMSPFCPKTVHVAFVWTEWLWGRFFPTQTLCIPYHLPFD